MEYLNGWGKMKASIVICTLNRPKQLALVWDDLMKQTYKDFEIIISTEKGITNAMNSALKEASGDIIIRLDDDVRVPKTWLGEIIEVFKDPKVGGVTGPTIIPDELKKNRDLFRFDTMPEPFRWIYINYFHEGNPYKLAKMNKCGAFSLGSNYEWARKLGAVRECDYLESTNYCLRTDLVRQLGGWDVKFDGVSEYFEQDMVYKIKKLGYKMVYNPKAYIHHMVNTGGSYGQRFGVYSRVSNWIRFCFRHLLPYSTIESRLRLYSYFIFQCLYYAYIK